MHSNGRIIIVLLRFSEYNAYYYNMYTKLDI